MNTSRRIKLNSYGLVKSTGGRLLWRKKRQPYELWTNIWITMGTTYVNKYYV
jgi:hypothetical protein